MGPGPFRKAKRKRENTNWGNPLRRPGSSFQFVSKAFLCYNFLDVHAALPLQLHELPEDLVVLASGTAACLLHLSRQRAADGAAEIRLFHRDPSLLYKLLFVFIIAWSAHNYSPAAWKKERIYDSAAACGTLRYELRFVSGASGVGACLQWLRPWRRKKSLPELFDPKL